MKRDKQQILLPPAGLLIPDADPRQWTEAMSALDAFLEADAHQNLAGAAMPGEWIALWKALRPDSTAAARVEAGLPCLDWLNWPVPWGMTPEMLYRLGIDGHHPVPASWAAVMAAAGQTTFHWVDVTGSQDGWTAVPVQTAAPDAGQLSESNLAMIWAARTARLLMAAEETGMVAPEVIKGYWRTLATLLNRPRHPYEGSVFHEDEVQQFLRNAAALLPIQTVDAGFVTPSGEHILKNEHLSLAINAAGRMHITSSAGSLDWKRTLAYTLINDRGKRSSLDVPHRISHQTDGLSLRARLPLPGRHHGGAAPCKIWTMFRMLNDRPVLEVETRFENLPPGHALSLTLPSLTPLAGSSLRTPWGEISLTDMTDGLEMPMGSKLELSSEQLKLTLSACQWPGFVWHGGHAQPLSLIYGNTQDEAVSDTVSFDLTFQTA